MKLNVDINLFVAVIFINMKIITFKMRIKDVNLRLKNLRKERIYKRRTINFSQKCLLSRDDLECLKKIIEKEKKSGLKCVHSKDNKKAVILHLPENLDLNENKDKTLQYIYVISELIKYRYKNGGRMLPKKSYNLVSVNFNCLQNLSTPAALVLTAELCNWEDTLDKKLRPETKKWRPEIYSQLHDLGFFDLFINQYVKVKSNSNVVSDTKLVRYIKGFCGDEGKIREFREGIKKLVGSQIEKWTFLASGLDEAITNVFHHAYPDDWEGRTKKKAWYMTGSFNEKTKELKVIFYDQGITIPVSLPASKWKENIYKLLEGKVGLDEKWNQAQLLKAAVDYGRTRTGDEDRGKGLGDLLVFIKKRESGMLSILSGKGHYCFTVAKGEESITTATSNYPLPGTLIIWHATL